MIEKPIKSFSSPSSAFVRNIWITYVMFIGIMIPNIPGFEIVFSITAIGMLVLLAILILNGRKKGIGLFTMSNFVFNHVDVYSERIILRAKASANPLKSRFSEIVSYSNIKVVKMNRYITHEDVFNLGRAHVFEIVHKFNKSLFVQFDLQGLDEFTELLKEKGVEIESAVEKMSEASPQTSSISQYINSYLDR